jgi:septum formation protein
MAQFILASGSSARKIMLQNAGFSFDVIPADIDENSALKSAENKGFSPAHTAQHLAREKALKIAAQFEDRLVIGSDQILECEGRIFSKAADLEEARDKLKSLRGRTHSLHSGVAVARGPDILWSHAQTAQLTMHDFSAEFLERYLAAAGEAATSCVGAYALEGPGVQLFEKIEGDYFTILGLPLLPLLTYLREKCGVCL